MELPEKIVETDKRLSQSLLWNLQREAYCQFGIEAWSQHGVPSYITSNSYIAKNYAQVVLGYLRDCIAQSAIDLEHPVYLMDLGAGTGRLAYFFLRELFQLLDTSSLPKIKLCYVMTDIAPSNLTFWQEHPYLKPYFEGGVLDCAYYYHAQRDPIYLVHRQETLSKKTLINPLVLICNYFFDTIPQDLFRVKDGHVEEGRITLFVKGNEAALPTPLLINQLKYRYAYHPISQTQPYYEIPEWNALLKEYDQRFEASPFLFPTGAFQSLRTFMELCQDRLLLIAGDRGVCTEEQIRQWGDPKLALHGSFSFPVNFHSISAFFHAEITTQKRGGTAHLTSFPDPAFSILVSVIGKENSRFPETALAFHEHIDNFEPTDYFKLVSLTEEKWKDPPLEDILLLIKLGNWDASVLLTFFQSLLKAIPAASEKQKGLLHATIDHAWEHFYPVAPSSGDFVLNLGVLLFEMKYFAEAKMYFERSMVISGINTRALKNIAACQAK
ncbi:MAG: hypothetical protein WCF65_07960 [Parachlamydiaceae bacterium]